MEVYQHTSMLLAPVLHLIKVMCDLQRLARSVNHVDERL